MRIRIRNKNIFSIISVLILAWSIVSYITNKESKKLNIKNDYINNCMQGLDDYEIPDSIKRKACACAFDYLYSKYGRVIYNTEFILPSKVDSLFVQNCMKNAFYPPH